MIPLSVQIGLGLGCLWYTRSLSVLFVLMAQVIHTVWFSESPNGFVYYGMAVVCDFFALYSIYLLGSQRIDLMRVCLIYMLVNTAALCAYVANAVVDFPFIDSYLNSIATITILQAVVMLSGRNDGKGGLLVDHDFWRHIYRRMDDIRHSHNKESTN